MQMRCLKSTFASEKTKHTAMKQKLLLIAAVTLLSAFQLRAQNSSKVTGQVKDAAGNGVATATVMLQNAKDSSLAKTAVSNGTGNYEFPAIKAGRYFIRVTATGMQRASTAVFEVKDNETTTAPSSSLQPAAKLL